jgi:tetratricopeptide (TPR) repeat protein
MTDVAYRIRRQAIRIFYLFSAGLLLQIIAAGGLMAQEGAVQLVSPLGRTLRAQPQMSEAVAPLTLWLASVPDSVDLWMNLGIALAGSWNYQAAIDAYSEGLYRDPFRALLYRHRGHRFISTRRLEAAAADLELSARLDPANWDTWYHLGLAYYLMGDFERADRAYHRCYELSEDDGALVAISDWLWMTLMRKGDTEGADRVLQLIGPSMEVGENTAYHSRLLMYKGLIPAEDLIDIEEADPLELATLGYGLGNYYLVTGQRDRAFDLFERVVEGPYWPAFGFIAAEAELARRR